MYFFACQLRSNLSKFSSLFGTNYSIFIWKNYDKMEKHGSGNSKLICMFFYFFI